VDPHIFFVYFNKNINCVLHFLLFKIYFFTKNGKVPPLPLNHLW